MAKLFAEEVAYAGGALSVGLVWRLCFFRGEFPRLEEEPF